MTPGLRSMVDGLRLALRRDASLAVLCLALSVVPLVLLLVWLLGTWSTTGVGPLLLDSAIIAAAAFIVIWGLRRWIRTLDEGAIANDVEQRTGMPEGALRGLLELERQVPPGTSAALARRARLDVEQQFAGRSREELTGGLGRRVRRRRSLAAGTLSVLTITALLLAFGAPERSRAAWAPLANPVRNLLPAPLAPLVVRPGSTNVNRGAELAVAITAPGRTVVTLHWKMQGDVPRSELVTVTADSGIGRIPRIDAAAEYWVAAPDGATSARFHVTPVDPLLLSELSVDVVYPTHVGRPAEHYSGEVPLLEIPEGTQLVVEGRATRALAQASLTGSVDGTGAHFERDGARFSGRWTPRQSGMYGWQLQDRSGESLAITPPPVEIVLTADAAPLVDITFPENDTLLDASLRQAIVADARDDYGLTSATLVSWRVGRDGRRDPDVAQPITLTGDDRTIIRALLDATERALAPGDTLKFFVRVTDNSPRAQTGDSRTIALWLPSGDDLRELSTREAEQLLEQARELARAAAEAHQATTALERRTAAANARRSAQQQGNRSGERGKMDFQEAAQARQALEKQQEMVERIEAMQKNLDALEQSMARSGMRDSELQQRMEELRKLYEEMLTPEMKKQLEQLQRAIEQLDPETMQKALEQIAKQQEELKEELQRTAEMLQRAATEQQINNLAQEARELATQQEALSQELSSGRSTPEQAKAQDDLARRAQELAKALGEMQQKLREQGEEAAADQTKNAEQQADQAGKQMKDAAANAAKQESQKASEQGKNAAENLERTADALDKARQAMADAQRQQVQESMQQATADALALAQAQQELRERMQQSEQQQGGEQPPQGQQKPGQQQQGQQQQGQQQGQQQQGQQQQGQQGRQGQQQGQQGQRPGQQQGQQSGQQGQQGGQPQPQQGQGQQGQQDNTQSLRSEQAALQQSLQQLGRNLTDAAEKSAGVNREVSSALARANISMQETLDAMQRGQSGAQEAQQTVDALNRLALSLLNNSQQLQQSQSGSTGQEAMQQLADLAKQQSSVNGQSNALVPLNLSQQATAQQMNRLSSEQMEIARKLGSLNQGGQESALGEIDALAREAAELARQLQGGRIPPEVLARQERLFHRLLDAGRSLEKEEFEEKRTGERAGSFDPRQATPLDPRLFQDPTRFRAPTAEELQSLPPGYRRLILDYFERLNRPAAPVPPAAEKPTGR